MQPDTHASNNLSKLLPADVLARVNPGGGALRKSALSAAAQLLAQDSVGLPDTPSLGGEDRDKLAAALREQLGSRWAALA